MPPCWPSPETRLSATAAPGCAVAVKATVSEAPVDFGTLAVTRCSAPASRPSVHVVDAVPSAPVCTLAAPTLPPPATTANTICRDTEMPLTVSGEMNIWYWQ